MAKLSLYEAKTGIRGELGVAGAQTVQLDGVVQTSKDSLHQVLHHDSIVLILATAVVSMQTGGGFTKAIIAEK